MLRTRSRPSRHRASAGRAGVPSASALRAMLRPIVRELVAEELEWLEDRRDAREALAEPGGITHEELMKKLGL